MSNEKKKKKKKKKYKKEKNIKIFCKKKFVFKIKKKKKKKKKNYNKAKKNYLHYLRSFDLFITEKISEQSNGFSNPNRYQLSVLLFTELISHDVISFLTATPTLRLKEIRESIKSSCRRRKKGTHVLLSV